MATLRVGDPLDKNTDVGAINSRMQLERIEELVESGEEEGAEIYQPPCRLPEKGYWFVPTVFTNVAQSYRIAQEEIFGPVLSVLTFRTPEEALEKANNTAVRALGRGVDREGLADPLDGAAAPRRRRVGEHLQPLRPRLAVRRLQGIRLRPRGRPARARAVPRVRRVSMSDRLPVKKTYKLFIGGAFPRSESGPHLRGGGAERRAASRKDVRDAVKAARAAPPRWAGDDGLQPRAGALPRRGDDGGARADFAELCVAAATEVEAAIDRVVWYAGWSDKLAQVLGSSNPVAGPYFNFTVPEPTGVVGVLAPDEPALLGLVSRLAPVLVGGNAAVVVASSRSRSPPWSSPRCWRPPTCPAASSTCSPAGARSWRRCSRRTWT